MPVIGWVSFYDLEDNFPGDLRKPGVLVTLSSWGRATGYYSYDPENNHLEELALESLGPYDRPKDVVSREMKVESHDGTLVPLSIGGITIGRAVTDRPDLFAVAFPVVGLLDTLRSESTANGASNVPEYGTIKDETGFSVLREISTYDHIKDGTAYPAILLYHGYNDPRVDVWMSAKAGARFQAATTSGKPVLLDIDYESGHGVGNTSGQNIRRTTDLLAVMLWQLGDPEFQPAE